MDPLARAVARRARTRAADEAALAEVHEQVALALAARRPVSEVLTATGYSRETVRRIARERGVEVDGRATRTRP